MGPLALALLTGILPAVFIVGLSLKLLESRLAPPKHQIGNWGFGLGALFLILVGAVKILGPILTRAHTQHPAFSLLIPSVALVSLGTSCFFVSWRFRWPSLLWPPVLVSMMLMLSLHGVSDQAGYKHMFALMAAAECLSMGIICALSGVLFGGLRRSRAGIHPE